MSTFSLLFKIQNIFNVLIKLLSCIFGRKSVPTMLGIKYTKSELENSKISILHNYKEYIHHERDAIISMM